jgi:hypothetical protein
MGVLGIGERSALLDYLTRWPAERLAHKSAPNTEPADPAAPNTPPAIPDTAT